MLKIKELNWYLCLAMLHTYQISIFGSSEIQVQIIREGSYYVALCPELNLSSYGDSASDAKEAFNEVLQAWLEDAHITDAEALNDFKL